MARIREEVRAIAGVATRICSVGDGPPVLVVNGGPGFSQNYLHIVADPLAGHRTVVFYDQPGCGGSPIAQPATADLTFRHFADLVDTLFPRGELGLLAHSWGTVVVLGARAAGMRRQHMDQTLLVAPVPVNRPGYDQASANLFARMPAAVQARYIELAGQGRSGEIVDLLLPYYLAKPAACAIGLTIDIATFAAVTASLGDFDLRAELPFLAGAAMITTGADFCTPDLVANLTAIAGARHFLPEVGHFPAHEAPAEVAKILRGVFTSGRT